MFGGGREQGGLRARFEVEEWKAGVLAESDFALVPRSLLRDLGVGGGERPASMKWSSRSDAIVEVDRRESALLLIDRSGVSSTLASSLAT